MNIGDRVQRNHVHDGTALAGKPCGPILTVTDVHPHKHFHGISPNEFVCYLSDGGWSFDWNITRV